MKQPSADAEPSSDGGGGEGSDAPNTGRGASKEGRRTSSASRGVVPLEVTRLGRLRSSRPPETEPGSAPPGTTRSLRPSWRPGLSDGSALRELVEYLPGRTVLGGLRVERLVGRGTTAIVVEAIDLERDHRFALKLFDPELVRGAGMQARFRADAALARRIATRGVPELFEVELSSELALLAHPAQPFGPPVPYVLSELLVGRDLRAVLSEEGPLTAARATTLLRSVASTLDTAHALGFVHGNLKPANLFLEDGSPPRKGAASDSSQAASTPSVRVLDYGVASFVERAVPAALAASPRNNTDARTSSLGAQPWLVFGTPWYVAPEVAEGGPLTSSADLWSLAIVAFRLLTGASYWAPCPQSELLAQIVAGPRQLPHEVVAARGLAPRARLGRAFDRWFRRACSAEPERRFAYAHELVDTLEAALTEDACSHSSTPPASDR
jgi:serine/threonine protein kinase